MKSANSYVMMDICNNRPTYSDITELISRNQVTDVATLMEKNPRLLLDNPELIKRARSRLMVETLLCLEKKTDGSGTDKNKEPIARSFCVDGNSRNNDAIQRSRDDFAAAFNISLPTILQRWSSVALKVLDNQIKYTGYCKEDPELKVEIDTSLLTKSQLETQHCFSVLKSDQLIELSKLDITEPISRQILLHLVILSFLHLQCKSARDSLLILFKLLLLIVGLITKIFKFHRKNGFMCIPLDEDAEFAEHVIYLWSLLTFFLIFFLHTFFEAPKLISIHKNHQKEFALQLFVFLSTFLLTDTLGYTNQVFDTIFIMALLMNLLEALSTSVICGKYVLLYLEVVRTLIKAVPPIVLLILALAAGEFMLGLEDIWANELKKVRAEQNGTDVAQKCPALVPFHGRMGEIEFWYFIKSTLQMVSVMYGQIDNSDVSRSYLSLRDPDSEVVASHAIHWFLAITFTTLILMNLLVGLTIRDVRENDDKVDCLIVQMELKRMYREIVWKNMCFYRCIARVWMIKEEDGSKVMTMYPNLMGEICGYSSKIVHHRFFSKYSSQFILGCRRVKKSVLEHYK